NKNENEDHHYIDPKLIQCVNDRADNYIESEYVHAIRSKYASQLHSQLPLKLDNSTDLYGYCFVIPIYTFKRYVVGDIHAFCRRFGFTFLHSNKSLFRITCPELQRAYIQFSSEEIKKREYQLRTDLTKDLRQCAEDLHEISATLAELDLSSSYAQLSLDRHYVRPHVLDETDYSKCNVLHIRNGRHPMVEMGNSFSLASFVPNDCLMDNSKRTFVITGANMSGKSTYIRTAALLVIMAQAGLFVPASEMTFAIVDQLFSRVGSTDQIAKDQSSFMVEMNECSHILKFCVCVYVYIC
ncbi:DNA mismatch repair protein MutS, partial [Reticulomyxa filosa]